jgi:hypothetical protein
MVEDLRRGEGSTSCKEVYASYELAEQALRRYVLGVVRRGGADFCYDFVTSEYANIFYKTAVHDKYIMGVWVTRRLLRTALSTRSRRT